MKIQDIAFIISLIVLLLTYRNKPKVFIWLGLLSLALSIPLFSAWVFFTAQRLAYYATGFFLVGILLQLFQRPHK